MKRTLAYILILVGTISVISPAIAAAANPASNPPAKYIPLEPLPCIPGGGLTCSTNGAVPTTPEFNFQNYVQYAFNLIIALAAAAAVFMIVYGGFQYMTTDSWNGKSEGVSKLKNALLGLLLVLTSYLILRTIDPRLVAISSTLVKPLNITYTKNTDFDTLGQLQLDASMYGVDVAGIKAKAEASDAAAQSARNDQAAIEKQIMDLQGGTVRDATAVAALCGNLPPQSSAELKDLCNKRAIAQDAAMTAAGESKLVIAQGTMDAMMKRCINSSDPSCFDDLLNQVKTKLNDTGPLLQPDQKFKLQAYAAYASSVIYINSEIADLTKKGITLDHSINRNETRGKNLLSTMANLTNAVNAYTSSSNVDPSVLSTMQEHQKNLEKIVNNLMFGK